MHRLLTCWPVEFVCDGYCHLVLPQHGKLLLMKSKFEYLSSPWQIQGIAQLIHNKAIP